MQKYAKGAASPRNPVEGMIWKPKGQGGRMLRYQDRKWVPHTPNELAPNRPYTAAENEKVREFYRRAYQEGDTTPVAVLAQQLGRTEKGITTHAAKTLKITQQRAIKGGWCVNAEWSPAEIQVLKDNYPTKTIAEMMELLPGRSKLAIFNRAHALGLRQDSRAGPWSADERKALRIAWQRGIAIHDVATAINRLPMSASKYAKNHGFDFGRRPLLRDPLTLERLLALEDLSAPLPTLAGKRARAKRPKEQVSDRALDKREKQAVRKRAATRQQKQREQEKARREEERKLAREKAAEERRAAREEKAAQRKAEKRRPVEQQQLAQLDRSAAVTRANQARSKAARQNATAKAQRLIDSGKGLAGVTDTATKLAFRMLEQQAEQHHRNTDPIEQAKLSLQRAGKVVCGMAVYGGKKDRFYVAGIGKDLTKKQLLEAAKEYGR